MAWYNPFKKPKPKPKEIPAGREYPSDFVGPTRPQDTRADNSGQAQVTGPPTREGVYPTKNISGGGGGSSSSSPSSSGASNSLTPPPQVGGVSPSVNPQNIPVQNTPPPRTPEQVIYQNLQKAREDTSFLSWSGLKQGAGAFFGDVKRVFMVDEAKNKVIPVLEKAEQKIRTNFIPQTETEKQFARQNEQLSLNLKSYNQRVEQFNQNPTSELTFRKLEQEKFYLDQRQKELQIRQENYSKSKEQSTGLFGASILTGLATSPIVLAKSGINLVSNPVKTIKDSVTGIKNLPATLISRPSSAGGELIGQVAGSVIIGQGLGLLYNKIKPPVYKEVKPKVTTSKGVTDTIRKGVDAQGNPVYYTEGQIITRVINPKTKNLINTRRTSLFSETIVNNPVDDSISTFSKAKAVSQSNKAVNIQPAKVTGKGSIFTSETKGLFNTADDGLTTGTARTIARQEGILRIRATPSDGSITYTRTPNSPLFETLTNIKAKAGQPIQNTRIFNLGNDVKLSVEGTSTPVVSTTLSDTAKLTSGGILNRDLGFQAGSIFEPAKLTTDGFINLKSGSLFSQTKTAGAVQGSITANVNALSKIIKSDTLKNIQPIKILETSKPVNLFTPIIKTDVLENIQSPKIETKTNLSPLIKTEGVLGLNFVNKVAQKPQERLKLGLFSGNSGGSLFKPLEIAKSSEKFIQTPKINSIVKPLITPSLFGFNQVIPPQMPLIPSGGILPFGLGEISVGGSAKGSASVKILGKQTKYNPSLGSILLGRKPQKVTKEQERLLSQRTFTGFEIRPEIEIANGKKPKKRQGLGLF